METMMNKTHSQFRPTTLEIDELERITGGRGIFELIGSSTDWYSASAGKDFDTGSKLTLGLVPGVGQIYGIAQGTVDTLSTSYDYFQGQASLTDVALAVGGLAVSLLPEGTAFRAAGETAVDVARFAADNTAKFLHPEPESSLSDSHPDGGADHGVDGVDAIGTSSSGDNAGVGNEDGAYFGSDFEGTDFGESDFGGNDLGGNDLGGNDFGGNDFGGNDFGGGYFGNDFGDSNFGGGDFGGSDFV